MSKDVTDWWSELDAAHSRVEQALADAVQKYGIGLSDYRALERLSASPNRELRMLELASLITLNQSSVTRLLRRLEELGWAHRDECAQDGRGIYAVITPEGRRRTALIRRSYAAALRRVLATEPLFRDRAPFSPAAPSRGAAATAGQR